MEHEETVRDIIREAGGQNFISRELKVSQTTVFKWCQNNQMPYTEWTGETDYCKRIAKIMGDSTVVKRLKATRK